MQAGQRVVIEQVKEGSVELLNYLVEVGLRPGQEITVEQVAPFDGPLLVSAGDRSFPLSREVAGKVAVSERASGQEGQLSDP